MSWFKKKQESFLGVDIGTSAIKIVELEKDKGRYNLKNYGIYPLGEYMKSLGGQESIDFQKIANEEMAEMIKTLLDKTGIKAKEASFSVPVYSSFSTVIDLPEMPEKEIAAAVPLEAKKYVPIPASEVVLDWAIVGHLGKTAGSQILVVAVPKKIITDYSQVAKLSGLKLNFVEAETFSLSRVLVGNDKSGIVLVDTGARSSNISIIDGGDIRATHNLEMGGFKLTTSISKNKNLTSLEAEGFKQKINLTQDTDIDRAVNIFLDSIINRVKKVVDMYQSKYGRKIEKCVLTGGSAQIPNVTDYFSNSLGVEVSLGNPFARVTYLPELKPIVSDLSSILSVAAGLAMR